MGGQCGDLVDESLPAVLPGKGVARHGGIELTGEAAGMAVSQDVVGEERERNGGRILGNRRVGGMRRMEKVERKHYNIEMRTIRNPIKSHYPSAAIQGSLPSPMTTSYILNHKFSPSLQEPLRR